MWLCKKNHPGHLCQLYALLLHAACRANRPSWFGNSALGRRDGLRGVTYYPFTKLYQEDDRCPDQELLVKYAGDGASWTASPGWDWPKDGVQSGHIRWNRDSSDRRRHWRKPYRLDDSVELSPLWTQSSAINM